MIKQYFTYRLYPMPDGGFIGPDLILKKSFTGLNFQYNLNVVSNRKKDSRILAYIEAETQEIIDVVLEGLSQFSVHKKTTAKAKTFAKQIYDSNDIEVKITEGTLIITKSEKAK